MPELIAAIDQGTTSTRCILLDHDGKIVCWDQKEHAQIFPRPGWVEHDPEEIWANTLGVVRGALEKGGVVPADVVALGVTNQRETTVVWDRRTGKPLYNAIVWQDTRTEDICAALGKDGGREDFRERTGLPPATYFSGPKLRWILDNVPGARAMAERGDALFGTMESFLLWRLTGGPAGGLHITDVTNASRTLLLNLRTLEWDEDSLQALHIPRAMLPEVRSSSEVYGRAVGPLEGVPLGGALGDQQAALVGQTCFAPGEAKNTYGTGSFLLMNTGTAPVASRHGLLTSVGYRFGGAPPAYVLEGSIAVTGSLIQWLRDNLGLISSAPEVETLANTVTDNGGVYFVPAFSGLFAPYWRAEARGLIAGLTGYAHKGHIARAALEAAAFQTREVADAMEADSGVRLAELRADGGMAKNDTLMQFQADLLGVPVARPRILETTALGAAYAAGLAVGFWNGPEELRAHAAVDRVFKPAMEDAERARLLAGWKRAVERTFD
jgi:glycerol kinase